MSPYFSRAWRDNPEPQDDHGDASDECQCANCRAEVLDAVREAANLAAYYAEPVITTPDPPGWDMRPF